MIKYSYFLKLNEIKNSKIYCRPKGLSLESEKLRKSKQGSNKIIDRYKECN